MTKYRLSTKDAAIEALREVVREQPDKCNPKVKSAYGDDIITQLMLRCNLPVIPTPLKQLGFLTYWSELPLEHRHRLAIPRDVAEWLHKVASIFDGPMDFDHPSAGRVQWNVALRRCRSRFLV